MAGSSYLQRAVISVGVGFLLLTTACGGLGVDVPTSAANPSGSESSSEPAPDESVSPEPSPDEPVTPEPSDEAPAPSRPPTLDGWNRDDPSWVGAPPPQVFRSWSSGDVSPDFPKTIGGKFTRRGVHDLDGFKVEAEYSAGAESGGFVQAVVSQSTLYGAEYAITLSNVGNPRPVGISLCGEAPGVGSANCVVVVEDRLVQLIYMGPTFEMSVDELAPLAEEFVARYAAGE